MHLPRVCSNPLLQGQLLKALVEIMVCRAQTFLDGETKRLVVLGYSRRHFLLMQRGSVAIFTRQRCRHLHTLEGTTAQFGSGGLSLGPNLVPVCSRDASNAIFNSLSSSVRSMTAVSCSGFEAGSKYTQQHQS